MLSISESMRNVIPEFEKLGIKVKYKISKRSFAPKFNISVRSDHLLFEFAENFIPEIVVLNSDRKHSDVLLRVGRSRYLCSKSYALNVTDLKDYDLEELRILAKGDVIIRSDNYKLIPSDFRPPKDADIHPRTIGNLRIQLSCETEGQIYVSGKIEEQGKFPITLNKWYVMKEL